MLNPFLVVFGVRRVHVRGKQAVATEIGFIFMSMNLTKLAKNLASKTSTIQKPHSVSFSLIGFKTGITVWFDFEASFCPTSFFNMIERKRTHKGEIYDKSNLWRKKRGCNLQN